MKYTSATRSGREVGSKIGFPTINMDIPSPFLFEYGVYAGWVYIKDMKYMAAFHFGPIAIFNDPEPALEAFLLNAQLEKTPSVVSFELVKYIRPTQSFKNIIALAKQMQLDVKEVRKILQGV